MMTKYFICGPSWIRSWLSCAIPNSTCVDSASKCDLYVVSLYCLGTVKGVIMTKHKRTADPPKDAKSVFILIDVFTQNQRIATGEFDYVIHPYRNPPPIIASSAKSGSFFIPVYGLFHTHVEKSLEESVNCTPAFDRRYKCVFLSSHPTGDRARIPKVLSSFIEIEIFGNISNRPVDVGEKRDEIHENVYKFVCDLYRQAEYVLIIENEQVDGYVSEKIDLALACGATPIYFGALDVADYVNDKYIITGSWDNPESVVSKIVFPRQTQPPAYPDYFTDHGLSFINRIPPGMQLDAHDS